MLHLEDLTPNASIKGILPDSLVTVVSVQWYGSEAVELTYKTATAKVVQACGASEIRGGIHAKAR